MSVARQFTSCTENFGTPPILVSLVLGHVLESPFTAILKLRLPKVRRRLAEQSDPLDYWEQHQDADTVWLRNYALDAMRGQAIVLSEAEARERNPDLLVASSEAIRKDNSNDVTAARVLFDRIQ